LRREDLVVESVAADTEVLKVALAGTFMKVFDRPAVREAHAFGLAGGDGLVDGVGAVAIENGEEWFGEEVAEGKAGLDAAGVDIAGGIDGDLAAGVASFEEVESTGPLVTEVVGEGSGGEVIEGSAATGPEFADPLIRVGAEAGIVEADGFDDGAAFLVEGSAGGGLFEALVEGVEAGDRDGVDTEGGKFAGDRGGEYVAGGLDDDADALGTVAGLQELNGGVENRFANGVEEDLAAGEDDSAGLFVGIEKGEARREIGDDAWEIRDSFGDSGGEMFSVIRAEAIFVAMGASSVAKPRHDIVERFHEPETMIMRSGTITAKQVLVL
jgi:hypothetical protein